MYNGLKFCLIVFVTLFPTLSFSQQEGFSHTGVETFPSPTAASFAKAEEIPVDFFNGTMNLSIPLHSFSYRNYSLPITLNYVSTGFKVQERASWAGLGWNLKVGGVITRVVRGLPDDRDLVGYMDTIAEINRDWPLYETDPDDRDILDAVADGNYDSEPDKFVVSTPTVSGEMYYMDGKFRFSFKNKAEVHYTSTTNQISSFTITDETGIIYTFDVTELTRSNVASAYDSWISSGSNSWYISSWYLSKIEHPGSDSDLILEYDTGGGTYNSSQNTKSEAVLVYDNTGSSLCTSKSNSYTESFNFQYNRVLYLSKIRLSDDPDTYVEFHNSSRSDLINERKLDYISIFLGGAKTKEIDFSQSYFLGSNGHKRLRLDSVKVKGVSGALSMPPYKFEYPSSTIPDYDSFAVDHWGYYNGQTSNFSYIPTTQYGGATLYSGANKNSYPSTIGMLTKVTYPTGGSSSFQYEVNDYSYIKTNSQGSQSNAGGMRIKSITMHDGITTTNDVVKNYNYDMNDGSGLSSGVLDDAPTYIQTGTRDFYDEDTVGNYTCSYKQIMPSSFFSLGDYSGTHLGYKKVTEETGSLKNYGKIVHHFEKNPHGNEKGNLIKKEVIDENSNTLLKEVSNYNYIYNSSLDYNRSQGFQLERKISSYTYGGGLVTIYDTTFVSDGYLVFDQWEYKSSDTLKVYNLSSSPIVSYNSYNYQNHSNILSSITSRSNNGEVKKKNFIYAASIYVQMRLENMLTQLYSIETEDGDNTTLSYNWFEWNNNSSFSPGGKWRLWKNWVWKGGANNPSAPTVSNADLVAEIIEYDNFGNVLEYKNALGATYKNYFGSNSNPYTNATLNTSAVNGLRGVFMTGIKFVKSGDDLQSKVEYDIYGNVTKSTDPNLSTKSYTYDQFHRLKEIRNSNNILVESYDYNYSLVTPSSPNYIQSTSYYDPNNTANNTKTVKFLDGLGRSIQTQIQGANTTIITDTRYNERGLLEVTSLPFKLNNQTSYVQNAYEGTSASFIPGGSLHTSSEIENEYESHPNNDGGFAYSQIQYEASPLSRKEKSTLPGVSYKMGSGNESETTYSTNTFETFATASQGTTPAKTWLVNTLTKTISKDPSGKKTISYSDGWGQTIASGVDMNNDDKLTRSSSDLVTEFAYDLLGNLVRVEDPRGLATTYTYNKKGELISKKLPDQDFSVDYKYSKSGLLKFIHDPNQKSQEGSDISINIAEDVSFAKTITASSDGKLSFYLCVVDLFLDNYVITLEHIETSTNLVSPYTIEPEGDCIGAYSNPITINVNPGTYRLSGQANDTGEPILSVIGNFSFTANSIYTYNKYDDSGRITETGEYSGDIQFDSANPNSQTFPTTNNSPSIYYYYDGVHAPFSAGYVSDNAKGRLTKVSYRDLSSVSGWGNDWLSYNNFGLVEWKITQPYGLSNPKLIEYDYDELGRNTEIRYNPTTTYWGDQFFQRYSYDEFDRIEKVETSANGGAWIKDAEYTGFLATGQPTQLKLGNFNIQTVDYVYTVQGWLKKINNPSSIGGDKFAMELDYYLNGNISQQDWRQPQLNGNLATYSYLYDDANRLISANFSGSGYNSNAFDVSGLTYDKNGGLEIIFRKNNSGSIITEFDIQIKSGSNRISGIDDYVALEQWGVSYDASGNMVENEMKGFSSVDYDWRNLPAQMIAGVNTLQYAYDSEGNRVKKKLESGVEIHYVRGAGGETMAVYTDDDIQFQNILAGSDIIGTWDDTERKYFLKDHLGSVRTTVDQSGNVDGYDDYYPFGLVMPGRSSNSANPNDNYKFTGHERDDEAGINLDYMMARNYDPVLGRFLQIDPYAAKFPNLSPYNYALNNPLRFIDPDGRAAQNCCLTNTITGSVRPIVNAYHFVNAITTGNQKSKNIIVGQLKAVQTVNSGVQIAASGALAPTATLVGMGTEVLFSGDDSNLGGASVRGAVADQLSEAVPAGGVVTDMAIGATVEVIAGFGDRAASQEGTELTDITSDAIGGAVGSVVGNAAGQRASAVATKKITQKAVGGAASSTGNSLYDRAVNWVNSLFNRDDSDK